MIFDLSAGFHSLLVGRSNSMFDNYPISDFTSVDEIGPLESNCSKKKRNRKVAKPYSLNKKTNIFPSSVKSLRIIRQLVNRAYEAKKSYLREVKQLAKYDFASIMPMISEIYRERVHSLMNEVEQYFDNGTQFPFSSMNDALLARKAGIEDLVNSIHQHKLTRKSIDKSLTKSDDRSLGCTNGSWRHDQRDFSYNNTLVVPTNNLIIPSNKPKSIKSILSSQATNHNNNQLIKEQNSYTYQLTQQTSQSSLSYVLLECENKESTLPLLPTNTDEPQRISTALSNAQDRRILDKSNGEIGEISAPNCSNISNFMENIEFLNKKMTHILVPRGLYRTIHNYTYGTKEEKELALIFVSLMRSRDLDEYKGLHSKYLDRIAKQITETSYATIIKRLLRGTEKGPIIEWFKDGSYQKEKYSRKYRVAVKYARRKTHLYKLKHPVSLAEPRNIDNDCILSTSLVWSMPRIQLPTIEEVMQRAIEMNDCSELIMGSYRGKRVRKIARYVQHHHNGKKSTDYYIDNETRRYNYRLLDLDINEFHSLLLRQRYRIPSTTDNCARIFYDLSGGIAKWIRKLIRIDGEEIVEVDYTALHPNIIYIAFAHESNVPQEERDLFLNTFSGDIHSNLVRLIHVNPLNDEEFKKVRDAIKIEGLSFWNDKISNWSSYSMYEHIESKFPNIMSNVMKSKTSTFKQHAETANILFSIETQLMKHNAEVLQKMDIPFIYAYDALWVAKSSVSKVKEIMNANAKEMGIPTIAA